jgi:hypothetical protein
MREEFFEPPRTKFVGTPLCIVVLEKKVVDSLIKEVPHILRRIKVFIQFTRACHFFCIHGVSKAPYVLFSAFKNVARDSAISLHVVREGLRGKEFHDVNSQSNTK